MKIPALFRKRKTPELNLHMWHYDDYVKYVLRNDFTGTRENLTYKEAEKFTLFFENSKTQKQKLKYLRRAEKIMGTTRCKKHFKKAKYKYCLEDKKIQISLETCCCDDFENLLIRKLSPI